MLVTHPFTPCHARVGGDPLNPPSTSHNSPRELWLVLGGFWSLVAQRSHLRLRVEFAFPTQSKVQHSAIVADSIVAARRRRALPSLQDISTASLPTIPGAVEACGLGDCSRDPLFQVSCEIAFSQPGVAGASHSSQRLRQTRPHASAAIRTSNHWDQPPGVAVGGKDD